MNNLLGVLLATGVYLAFTITALLLLRRQGTDPARWFLFLGYVVGSVFLTRFTVHAWHLLMGEAAVAWLGALVLLGIIASTRFTSYRRM